MNAFVVENMIREKLGEMFGARFKKLKLVTGYDSNKRPQIHEFDLVSESMEIVGEIKAGKCTRGNFCLALADCMYLGKVKAPTKLMAFADRELYEYFKVHSEGLIDKSIRPILIQNQELQTISQN